MLDKFRLQPVFLFSKVLHLCLVCMTILQMGYQVPASRHLYFFFHLYATVYIWTQSPTSRYNCYRREEMSENVTPLVSGGADFLIQAAWTRIPRCEPIPFTIYWVHQATCSFNDINTIPKGTKTTVIYWVLGAGRPSLGFLTESPLYPHAVTDIYPGFINEETELRES